MSGETILFRLFVVVCVIAANGLFVATEYALIRIRKTRIEEMVREGVSGATVIRYLHDNLERSVAGAQLGVTAASLLVGWLGESAIQDALEFVLALIPGMDAVKVPGIVAIGIAFAFMCIMHVVMGEQVPKFIAIHSAETTLRRLSRVFALFCTLGSPLIWLMNKIARLVLWPMGITCVHNHDAHSPRELLLLVDESERAGEISEQEGDLVERALEMNHRIVREVMIPRKDMACISVDSSLDEVLAMIAERKHTKLPVFDGAHENVVGILSMQDMFELWKLQRRANTDGGEPAEFAVTATMREPHFVLDTLKANCVLHDMKAQHIRMSIIVDEFGTVLGLVTIEDLIEELVGDIYDEDDTPLPDVEEIRENTYKVKGGMTLPEFNKAFASSVESEDSSTIAGALIEALGRQPETGDTRVLDGFNFTVLEMDGQAIAYLEVRRV